MLHLHRLGLRWYPLLWVIALQAVTAYAFPTPDLFVRHAVSQPDGKIIVAGPSASSTSTPVRPSAIYRLEPDGRFDSAFLRNAEANGPVNAVVLQPDGKILLAGDFSTVNRQPRNRIARLHPDGTLDAEYAPGVGPDAAIDVLVPNPRGGVIVGGSFRTWNGVSRNHLTQLESDGTLDPQFDAGARIISSGLPRVIYAIALQADGLLIVGGLFTVDGTGGVVRLAPDGKVDTSFQARGISIQSILVQPDQKIIMAGALGLAPSGGSAFRTLGRYNADGTEDTTFRQTVSTAFAAQLHLQPDGRILVLEKPEGRLVRVNPDGSLDSTFQPVTHEGGPQYSRGVYAVDLRPDGRIVIGGSFSTVSGAARDCLARIFHNGRVDPGFVPVTGYPDTNSLGLNFSGRAYVPGADDPLIGGFMIDGTGTRKIVVRALGPSLIALSNPLQELVIDPALELYDASGSVIAQNDDWQRSERGGLITSDQSREISELGLAPRGWTESALIAELPAGNYTAVVRGKVWAGAALLELYDVTSEATAFVSNLSTRGGVEGGERVLISGIILAPPQLSKLLVRAIGPSLDDAEVADVLDDPLLRLHNGHGDLVMENDDWTNTQESEIKATQLAPERQKEAAMLVILQPGTYTAVVHGGRGTTGTAVVEVFALR